MRMLVHVWRSSYGERYGTRAAGMITVPQRLYTALSLRYTLVTDEEHFGVEEILVSRRVPDYQPALCQTDQWSWKVGV